jgi:ferredoxin
LTRRRHNKEDEMPVVTFVNEKKEIQVPVGANLRSEAMKAGIQVYSGVHKVLHCPGLGQCGSCRVKIIKGQENASPMGFVEKLKFRMPVPDPMPCLAFIGNEDTMRLSCQTKVMGDMTVETHPPLNLWGETFYK